MFLCWSNELNMLLSVVVVGFFISSKWRRSQTMYICCSQFTLFSTLKALWRKGASCQNVEPFIYQFRAKSGRHLNECMHNCCLQTKTISHSVRSSFTTCSPHLKREPSLFLFLLSIGQPFERLANERTNERTRARENHSVGKTYDTIGQLTDN